MLCNGFIGETCFSFGWHKNKFSLIYMDLLIFYTVFIPDFPAIITLYKVSQFAIPYKVLAYG